MHRGKRGLFLNAVALLGWLLLTNLRANSAGDYADAETNGAKELAQNIESQFKSTNPSVRLQALRSVGELCKTNPPLVKYVFLALADPFERISGKGKALFERCVDPLELHYWAHLLNSSSVQDLALWAQEFLLNIGPDGIRNSETNWPPVAWLGNRLDDFPAETLSTISTGINFEKYKLVEFEPLKDKIAGLAKDPSQTIQPLANSLVQQLSFPKKIEALRTAHQNPGAKAEAVAEDLVKTFNEADEFKRPEIATALAAFPEGRSRLIDLLAPKLEDTNITESNPVFWYNLPLSLSPIAQGELLVRLAQDCGKGAQVHFPLWAKRVSRHDVVEPLFAICGDKSTEPATRACAAKLVLESGQKVPLTCDSQ